ncbi:MAG: glutathione S-transferase [Planktomarina sp.]
MTYDLYIGDQTYSSWSMRGWLMLRAFDLPFKAHMVGLYDGTMAADLADLAPARLVPVLRTAAGHVVQDTLAMGETLHEENPDAGLWPKDPAQRALARGITAEMHSGFGALRSACPMNLEHAWDGFEPSADVQKDVARIEELWAMAFDMSGSDAWLFGDYSLADVFYAPIAARLAGYGITIGDQAAAYVNRHLTHELFQEWRAEGLKKSYDTRPYRLNLPEAPWPV